MQKYLFGINGLMATIKLYLDKKKVPKYLFGKNGLRLFFHFTGGVYTDLLKGGVLTTDVYYR